MEFYEERLVRVKKTKKQKALVLILFLVALIVLPLIALFFYAVRLAGIGLGAICLLAWGLYVFITRLDVEYEYQLTASGHEIELNIAKIINGKKRKEIFQGDCKEFEIVAKKGGTKDSDAYHKLPNKYEYVRSMDEPDVYFIVTHTEKGRAVIYLQLNEKMIACFKKSIPSKIFDY